MHHKSQARRTGRLIAITVATILAHGAAAAAEPASSAKHFDIRAQGLASALNEFASQSDRTLLFSTEAVEALRTKGLRGELEPEAALQKLLNGTGLGYRMTADKTILVGDPHTSKAATGLDAAKIIRLARAQGSQGETFASEIVRQDFADGTAAASHSEQTENARDRIELEEILVTGTHIRGAQELPMPVMVFTREEIEKTGYSRVEDLMRSIPQNLAGVTPAVGPGSSPLSFANGGDEATGVDLRGLGPQSTLTLLNGQRRAGALQGRVVDVSAIPLSAIERVEVVTGGRSAIYGSDAVAGVVNFVTRRDFEGAESTAYYGESGAGGERLQLSQIYGRRGGRGGFVAAYDYSDSSPLDASDAGVVRRPSLNGFTPVPGQNYLFPEAARHSAFLSGGYTIGSVELYADGLYSNQDTTQVSAFHGPEGLGLDFFSRTPSESDQYSVAPGMRMALSDRWGLNVSGVHSGYKRVSRTQGTFSSGRRTVSESELSSLSAVLDGLVASSEAIEVRSAMGIEHRRESVEYELARLDSDRTVDSVFAEALVSMLPSSSGQHRLQVSLAGRYSDYSDFGNSFDPQLGVSLNAGAGLTLRSAYSTAFRAPDQNSLNEANFPQAFLIAQPDPQAGGTLVPTLLRFGRNAGLQPEEAETWSVGLDYEPQFAPGLRLSASYFDIRYEKRIAEPIVGFELFTILQDEDRYPGLIDRSPSAELLQAILDQVLADGEFLITGASVPFDPRTQSILEVFPNLVLFDGRVNNLAIESMRGIDATFTGAIDHGSGRYSFGINGVYYLEFERQLTKSSPAIPALNGLGKTVDFRLRADAGWENSVIGASVFLNYIDSYEDDVARPTAKIDSWTTVDATLRFFGSGVKSSGLLDGLSATLAVQNLFDRAPPELTSDFAGLRYDVTNADPHGRFVSLSLVKKW